MYANQYYFNTHDLCGSKVITNHEAIELFHSRNILSLTHQKQMAKEKVFRMVICPKLGHVKSPERQHGWAIPFSYRISVGQDVKTMPQQASAVLKHTVIPLLSQVTFITAVPLICSSKSNNKTT